MNKKYGNNLLEEYIFVEVYGNRVICNCVHSSLEQAKETLNKVFNEVICKENNLKYGCEDYWKSDDEMSAWANCREGMRVWTIMKRCVEITWR